jgi:hypothetical protein
VRAVNPIRVVRDSNGGSGKLTEVIERNPVPESKWPEDAESSACMACIKLDQSVRECRLLEISS